jgi:hypothetical protein
MVEPKELNELRESVDIEATSKRPKVQSDFLFFEQKRKL